MAEDDAEKKHAPTERRLRQAAEQGDTRRSADLPRAAVIILVITVGLGSSIAIANRLDDFATLCLSQAGSASPRIAVAWSVAFANDLGPILGLIGALSIAAGVVTGGWVLSFTPLTPDINKINPGHGLAQLFSTTSLAETGKSMLKFVVIGGVAALMTINHAPDFEALAGTSGPNGLLLLKLCLQILVSVSIVISFFAAADVGLQFWLHRQKLRMTDAEIRNEMKDTVGNPQVRQRQRAIARRMARSRQMRRIPEASVVVTNPTHFAVAIRYRRGIDPAPIVLAKGIDLMATEIITRARSYGIPVIEAAPLARAIYRHVEPDEHVPIALYRACAEVLAYVWKMQVWRASGGPKPPTPKLSNMTIPDLGRQVAE